MKGRGFKHPVNFKRSARPTSEAVVDTVKGKQPAILPDGRKAPRKSVQAHRPTSTARTISILFRSPHPNCHATLHAVLVDGTVEPRTPQISPIPSSSAQERALPEGEKCLPN